MMHNEIGVEMTRCCSPTHWLELKTALSLSCCQLWKTMTSPDVLIVLQTARARDYMKLSIFLTLSCVGFLCVFQVIYTSFGGSSKGLHFNNLIVGLVLLTRGRDEEKAKCKLFLRSSQGICVDAILLVLCCLKNI